MTIRFDESLRKAVDVVLSAFGTEVLERSVFIRDVSGYLSIVVPTELDASRIEQLEAKLKAALEAYARPDRIITSIGDPGAKRLLDEGKKVPKTRIDQLAVQLLDRRIVGSDWLKAPAPSTMGVPLLVFSSLKGGVGRSTALTVVAAHLSKRGRRVLAIDCDLEAPGLGTMLLQKSELPRFGTLDYLVENGLSGIDPTFVADLIGNSYLGSHGARVGVIPAIGQTTVKNPADALAKIARAYLEDIQPQGGAVSLTEQLREMVNRFAASGEFDIVLIDARAGLHELTAGVILGLGADILLFGADEPQTYLGYSLLLAHLARFPVEGSDDWRDRLHFVQAKKSDQTNDGADERFLALLEILYPPEKSLFEVADDLTKDDFELAWDESERSSQESDAEPTSIIHVHHSDIFRNFDPAENRTLLDAVTYETPFRELLDFVVSLGFEASTGARQ